MIGMGSGRRYLALLLGVGLFIAACGGESDDGGESRSQDLIEIDFLLDYTPGGEHSAYALALDKGFFEEEGLSVTLREGTGSADAVKLVGNGTAELGNAQASAMILGVAQGAPVKAVANFLPSSGFILDWVRGRTPDLESPKDLEGKSIGLELGDPDTGIFPVFLAINGVDSTKVEKVIANDTRVALLRGKIDVRIGQQESLPEVEALDPSLEHGVLLFSDWGIDLMAHCIIANETFLEENPEVARGFVRAVQRGWEYALENPDEAIDVFMKVFPESDREAAVPALEITLEKLAALRPEGEPLGFISPEGFEQTLDILKNIEPAEGEDPPPSIELPATSFYTNEYLSQDF